MRRNPRAAVCFWGLLNRSIAQTRESILEHVYKPLQRAGFDITVFAHGLVVEADAYSNPRAFEAPLESWEMTAQDAVSALQCTHALLEDQKTVDARLDFDALMTQGDAYTADHAHSGADAHATFRNLVRALYSMNRVTQMWCAGAQQAAARDAVDWEPNDAVALASGFDVVLYVRPDAVLTTPLPAPVLGSVARSAAEGRSFAVVSQFMSWGGVNDTFALATPRAALAWGTRWRHALAYSQRAPLHSERFLLAVLQAAGVLIATAPLRIVRFRSGGVPKLDDFYNP